MANGFASPSISLPSVGTSFATSESKALVPYSPSGIMDNVKKLSPLESMQEVFYDIRDGIENLGNRLTESINNQTGLLNSTLLGVIHTLSNIGNIAAKDLDIEKATAKIAAKDLDIEKATAKEAAENEARKEKGEALGDKKGEGKGKGKGLGILGSIKNAFSSVIEALTPKSEGMKVGLIGLLTLGIMTQLDKLEKVFEGAFRFIDEKIMPGVKRGLEEMKKDFTNFKENMFGKDGFVPIIASGFSDVIDGLKEGDLKKSMGGLKTIFIDGTIKGIATAGDLAVGALDTILKTFGYEGPLLEDTQSWFRELPNNIDGYIKSILDTAQGVMDDVKKTFDEEGFLAAANVGVKGLHDNTTALALNFVADASGAVISHFGGEKIGKKLKDLDFKSENLIQSIKDLAKIIYDPETGAIFGMNFLSLKNLLPTLQEIADSIVSSLPKWMRPNTIEEQIEDIKADIAERKDEIKRSEAGEDVFVGVDAWRIGSKKEEIAKLEAELAELGLKIMPAKVDITNNGGSMKEKMIEIKNIETIRAATGATGNVTIMTDAKKVSGDTVAVSNTNVTNQRVDSIESSSNELLNYFRN